MTEHVRQEDSNSFECEDISKSYLTIQITYRTMDGSHIATDVSHIADEGPDDLHEDVRLDTFIEQTGVLHFRERLVDSLEYLLIEHICRHRGEVNPNPEDLL
jgi:hypothetical protein